MTLKPTTVSVIVITYNSEEFVVETLESLKDQDYEFIELIISDDHSTDNTLVLCQDWLEVNGTFFLRARLITTERNSGIPSNINRGIKEATGDYVKIIAADDEFTKSGLGETMKYLEANPAIDFLITQTSVFKNKFTERNFLGRGIDEWQIEENFSPQSTRLDQLEYILKGFHYPAPGTIIKRDLFERIGGYDERYPLIEDIPFYLKVLFNGYKIYFHPAVVVNYRKHFNNLTAKGNMVLSKFHLMYIEILYNSSIKHGRWKFIAINGYNFMIVKMIFLFGNRGWMCESLDWIRKFLNPRRFFLIIKRI